MRKAFFLLLLCLMSFAVTSCATAVRQGADTLEKRVEEYKEAVNYGKDNPERIYDFLCEEYREKITEEEFIKAYEKDRTYPYITPLYIWQPEYELSEDGMVAHVVYQQAARIVGMTWSVDFVYENGNYYVRDWDYLIDGSYLEKFEDCIYTLDWYYDTENMRLN